MIRVVAAAVLRDGRVLAARRGPGRDRAGLWELPGGKVETGESDAVALRREIAEELLTDIEVGESLGVAEHDGIRLVAYVCALTGDEPRPTEHAELRWLDASTVHTVEWAPADVPLVDSLLRRLRGNLDRL